MATKNCEHLKPLGLHSIRLFFASAWNGPSRMVAVSYWAENQWIQALQWDKQQINLTLFAVL